ncbi:hypothetical protein Hanom_Chr09g00774721 [Helianthus anomalus]
MFEEQENDSLERLNRVDGFWYNRVDENKNIWVKRLEYFLCKERETLDELENRFDDLIEHLKRYEIRLSNDEKISKFADALPAEWN